MINASPFPPGDMISSPAILLHHGGSSYRHIELLFLLRYPFYQKIKTISNEKRLLNAQSTGLLLTMAKFPLFYEHYTKARLSKLPGSNQKCDATKRSHVVAGKKVVRDKSATA